MFRSNVLSTLGFLVYILALAAVARANTFVLDRNSYSWPNSNDLLTERPLGQPQVIQSPFRPPQLAVPASALGLQEGDGGRKDTKQSFEVCNLQGINGGWRMYTIHERDVEAKELPGRKHKMIIGPDNFGAAKTMCFGVADFPPNAHAPGHVHDVQEEILYVLSGAGEMYFDGSPSWSKLAASGRRESMRAPHRSPRLAQGEGGGVRIPVAFSQHREA